MWYLAPPQWAVVFQICILNKYYWIQFHILSYSHRIGTYSEFLNNLTFSGNLKFTVIQLYIFAISGKWWAVTLYFIIVSYYVSHLHAYNIRYLLNMSIVTPCVLITHKTIKALSKSNMRLPCHCIGHCNRCVY